MRANFIHFILFFSCLYTWLSAEKLTAKKKRTFSQNFYYLSRQIFIINLLIWRTWCITVERRRTIAISTRMWSNRGLNHRSQLNEHHLQTWIFLHVLRQLLQLLRTLAKFINVQDDFVSCAFCYSLKIHQIIRWFERYCNLISNHFFLIIQTSISNWSSVRLIIWS